MISLRNGRNSARRRLKLIGEENEDAAACRMKMKENEFLFVVYLTQTRREMYNCFVIMSLIS